MVGASERETFGLVGELKREMIVVMTRIKYVIVFVREFFILGHSRQ